MVEIDHGIFLILKWGILNVHQNIQILSNSIITMGATGINLFEQPGKIISHFHQIEQQAADMC